jgi:hypothetical protein
MSSINQITAVIVESLLNSPYKGYYKKDYLSVLKTLNSIYQEKQKFEDWMVDDFVNQIVGGTNDLLKRYVKLGKSKECARNMLEHYIYWTYEIENTEEAENIKKAYEETTGLKYNKNKIEDLIHNNTKTLEKEAPSNSKTIVITITPPKNLDKNKILKFNFEGTIEPIPEPVSLGPVVEEPVEELVEKEINLEYSFQIDLKIFMFTFILIFSLLLFQFAIPSPVKRQALKDVEALFLYIGELGVYVLNHNVSNKIKMFASGLKEASIPIFKDIMNKTNTVYNRLY